MSWQYEYLSHFWLIAILIDVAKLNQLEDLWSFGTSLFSTVAKPTSKFGTRFNTVVKFVLSPCF